MNVIRIRQIDDSMKKPITEIGNQFYELSGLTGEFCPDHFIMTWNTLLRMNVATMFVAESVGHIVGAMGLVITPGLFDGAVTVQECFWFVTAEHRGRAGLSLFHEMLKWAEQINVERLLVAHIDHVGDLTKLFQKYKFKKLETVFMREGAWQ